MLVGASTRSLDTAEPVEAKLVWQALEGKPEAFSRLYEAHVDPIYRFLYFRVGDRQTAEDLTSQVFLKAWDSLDRCRELQAPFGAWVFRIARNTLIDFYRTRRDTSSLDELSGEAGPAVVMETEAEAPEIDQLRSALQELTSDQREVLTLKFIQGMSTEEAAQVAGKRPGAIRALQMRGLQALAQILKREAKSG